MKWNDDKTMALIIGALLTCVFTAPFVIFSRLAYHCYLIEYHGVTVRGKIIKLSKFHDETLYKYYYTYSFEAPGADGNLQTFTRDARDRTQLLPGHSEAGGEIDVRYVPLKPQLSRLPDEEEPYSKYIGAFCWAASFVFFIVGMKMVIEQLHAVIFKR